jgi:hypothetical protein
MLPKFELNAKNKITAVGAFNISVLRRRQFVNIVKIHKINQPNVNSTLKIAENVVEELC